MRSETVTEAAAITYRQLDYWIHRGYLKSSEEGSGNPRDLSAHEVAVAMHMGRLVRAGFVPKTAAALARDFADGKDAVQLPGFQLTPLTERPAS